MLAITRVDLANYLSTLLYIYMILIFVRVLMSWLPSMPQQPAIRMLVRFVDDVTEPYLGLFRRLLRPVGVGGMGIDLSPWVAVIVLLLVGNVVVNLVHG